MIYPKKSIKRMEISSLYEEQWNHRQHKLKKIKKLTLKRKGGKKTCSILFTCFSPFMSIPANSSTRDLLELEVDRPLFSYSLSSSRVSNLAIGETNRPCFASWTVNGFVILSSFFSCTSYPTSEWPNAWDFNSSTARPQCHDSPQPLKRSMKP